MSELTPALQHSPLAKLPPELRNLIFEYAVTQLAPIFVEDKDYHNPDRRISLRATPRCRPTALTQTCKQIRDEAEPLLYACNDFVIRLPRLPTSNDQPPGARAAKRLKHTMLNFVYSLHPANSPFLRYLRIELPTADYVNQRQKLVLQVWEPLLWLSHGAAYRLPNLKI
ncbi:hypothetical protein BDY17DRAFT_323822 [Neohortaea acidophila]|uniref:2EXR domain-containing protein n=1 Tax=Neohortaea acidophila TaxID=245834 RepID=A0A6A6PSI0_9PEZI|nr:uncharacterized protein BDY17DRAFT_323822 [Neohortaea acidophila]KAF2483058.1 hypothetical protein BDY17DRAFT_323822 [Neohortaea acidophila]